MCVWQLRKIWSTENHLRFDRKISHFERKIIYALILPSMNFRKSEGRHPSSSTHPKTEREIEGKVKKTTQPSSVSDPPTDLAAIKPMSPILPPLPLDRTQLPLFLPSSLNLTGFDEFFGLVWYYIFVWKLRKCEYQVENVFSIVFSRTQPNTKKYFSKYFLKCHQIPENIFN